MELIFDQQLADKITSLLSRYQDYGMFEQHDTLLNLVQRSTADDPMLPVTVKAAEDYLNAITNHELFRSH